MNKAVLALGLLVLPLLVPPGASSSTFSASDPEGDESVLFYLDQPCRAPAVDLLQAGLAVEDAAIVGHVSVKDLQDRIVDCQGQLGLVMNGVWLRLHFATAAGAGEEYFIRFELKEYWGFHTMCAFLWVEGSRVGSVCDGTVEGDTATWRLPLDGTATARDGTVHAYNLEGLTFEGDTAWAEGFVENVGTVRDTMQVEGVLYT